MGSQERLKSSEPRRRVNAARLAHDQKNPLPAHHTHTHTHTHVKRASKARLG